MYTELWELPHPATPAQSQREGSDESLQMGGTQVPTDSLTAGANTMGSLVGFRPEEWVGRHGCGREDSGQAKKLILQHFTKIPEGKLCTLYPELPNQHFLLCLIPNWIHCPKCRGLLCFFFRSSTQQLWEQWGIWQLFCVFQDSNWALKSLICQLIFIGSQFKKKKKEKVFL